MNTRRSKSTRQVLCVGELSADLRVAMAGQCLSDMLSHKGEASLMALVKMLMLSQRPEAALMEIPYRQDFDTAIFELCVPIGRADIAIFHVDGTASVIEVKDGSRGAMHVAAGIGQVALYALQAAQANTGLKRIRRCLLWSAVSDLKTDSLLMDACLQAGVIPIPYADLAVHLAASRQAVETEVAR